jgi:hypothetical protein
MVEYQIQYNGRKKRPDIGVVKADGSLFLLVECKAPDVALNEAVFLQLATYVAASGADFFAMTNGMEHIVAHIDRPSGKSSYLDQMPPYP